MSRIKRRGAEQARAELPALLADAASGRSTIITKHGRSVAALVPASALGVAGKQKPLTRLAGSGKRLWGADSTGALRKLRDEWSR